MDAKDAREVLERAEVLRLLPVERNPSAVVERARTWGIVLGGTTKDDALAAVMKIAARDRDPFLAFKPSELKSAAQWEETVRLNQEKRKAKPGADSDPPRG